VAAATGLGVVAALGSAGAQQPDPEERLPRDAYGQRPSVMQESAVDNFLSSGEKVRITKLETMLVKPRWLFLKVHTDAGVAGWGEPIVEGRAKTCAEAVREV
jgi:hypothetical protein